MTKQELIYIIKLAVAEVEWDYPIEYYIAFDKVLEIIESLDENEVKKYGLR